MIQGFFRRIMFGIIKVLANIVDTIISLIRMLLGLDPIGGSTENMLYDALTSSAVRIAFWWILALGVILSLVFAVIRIMRNYFRDEQDDGTISKSKALVEILKSIVNMVIMPVFVIALVLGTTAVAKTIDTVTKNPYTSYGTEIIFSIVDRSMLEGDYQITYDSIDSLDELDTKNYNYIVFVPISNQIKVEEYQSLNRDQLKPLRGMDAIKWKWDGNYYYRFANPNDVYATRVTSGLSKTYGSIDDIVDIELYFDNFLLPLLAGCVMVCSLGMAVIVVGQRVFNCVFLYVISPFIISIRPFDDGARYKKWCEIFISKLIGAYAVIICLNIFFLLSSTLASFTYFDSGFANGVAKIVIYISGTIAATGASQLVANLIGADAGQAERDNATQAFRALAPGAALAKSAVKGGAHLAGRFFGGKKETPLSANQMQQLAGALGGGNGGAGGNASTFSAGGQSMAGTIGNVMMGRTGVKDALKQTGRSIANSRVAQIGKGVGLLAGGLAVAPARAIKKGVDTKNAMRMKRALKNPQSRSATKLQKQSEKRLAKGKSEFTASQLRAREKFYNKKNNKEK